MPSTVSCRRNRTAASTRPGCAGCFNRRLSDWKALSDEEATILAAGQSSRTLASGESVFRAGSPGDRVFCVASGSVALRQTDTEGNSVLLQLAYPGDVLGYAECITGGSFSSDAEALGPCTVCVIERDTVQRLTDVNPTLGVQFLKRTSQHLQDARQQLVHNATLSNRARFAHLLMNLAERHGRRRIDGETTMQLPLSRRDLASLVGTRHETLSRIISRLDQEGVAYFSGRNVRIPRIDSLRQEFQIGAG